MSSLPQTLSRVRRAGSVSCVAAYLLAAAPAAGQKNKLPEPPRAKPVVLDRNADDASRYCANVAPSIAEARIAWQTKRLAELDAQVRQRIVDLEKAEASARDWIARRDEAMKAVNDDVVAIYAKMEAESAARQLSTMDDRTAVAILGRMKPNAAAAIFSEMQADRAGRLSTLIAAGGEKKS